MKPNYKMIKLLEENFFIKSYLASVDNDEKEYIIRHVIIKDMTKKNVFDDLEILKKLDHPNIIKVKEVFIQSKPVEAVNIVTEYADGDDLEQKIKEQKNKPFTETEILDYFTQICLALQYLHKKKIIHRNIKSSNIFLMKSGIVKLGGFKISKPLKKVVIKADKMEQRLYYLSPEILSNKPYNVKSDIWALGILLYELLTFKMPFNDQSLNKLTIKINKGDYAQPSSEYSSEIKDLLKKCLTTNPDIRPSIDEILNLPLIKNRINNKLNEVQYDQDLSTIMVKKYEDKKKEGKETLHQDKTAKEPDKKENPEKKIMNDKNKLANHFKKKAGSTNISTPISLSKINFLMQRKDPNFKKDKKYKEEEIGKILDARGYKDLLDDKSGNFDINKMSEEQYDQLRLLNILYKVANGQDQDSDGDKGASKEIIGQSKEENNEDKIKKEIEKEIGNDLLKEILIIIEKICGKNGIIFDKELIKKNILELTSKGFNKVKVEKAVDKIDEIYLILMKDKINA